MFDAKVKQALWSLVAERGVPVRARLELLAQELEAIETGAMADLVRIAATLCQPEAQALVVSAFQESIENAGQIRASLEAWSLVQPEETGRRRRRATHPEPQATDFRHVVGE